MISIARSGCPKELAGASRANDRYAHEGVVAALYAMQHGKCCYCECMISEEGHGKAVEHFAPKSVFRAKRNDWDNLLLVCSGCNGKKSDLFPVEVLSDQPDEVKVVYVTEPTSGEPVVINPSTPEVNPEDHLDFVLDDRADDFGLIYAVGESSRGRTSIDVLGLDRAFNTKMHRDHIIQLSKDYFTLLTAMNMEHSAETKRLEAEFRMLVSSRSRLTAVSRAFVREKKLSERFNVPKTVGSQ